MTMPEASINEHRLAPPDKGQIRFARQVFSMQPVSVAKLIRESPNGAFRFCIRTSNRLHRAAAHGGVFSHDRLIAVWPDWCWTTPSRVIEVERTVSAPSCETAKFT